MFRFGVFFFGSHYRHTKKKIVTLWKRRCVLYFARVVPQLTFLIWLVAMSSWSHALCLYAFWLCSAVAVCQPLPLSPSLCRLCSLFVLCLCVLCCFCCANACNCCKSHLNVLNGLNGLNGPSLSPCRCVQHSRFMPLFLCVLVVLVLLILHEYKVYRW